MSLDGYIARADGDVAWLDEATEKKPPSEDYGYHAFMDSVDLLILGRKTYEKVLSMGEWFYGEKRVIVLSGEPISFPASVPATVSHSSESPEALMRRLGDEGVARAYVDGGVTVQRFLKAGLIDRLTVTVIPVVLGGGIPLFGSLDESLWLTLENAQSYDDGLVQITYQVAPARAAS
ncbi:MAG: dihydrofolate reductase family protein [Blastopirellula sp. JB062]